MKYFLSYLIVRSLQCSYILNDHDQERQLDTKSLVGICRASYIVGRDIGSHNLKNRALDIGVRDSLDVTVSHRFVPDLKRLGTANGIS